MEAATAAYEAQIDRALVSYLTARGIDQDAATGARLGLCAEPMVGHEWFRGRLSIPYLTPAGVVKMRFRDIAGSAKSKYMDLPGARPKLYNAQCLARSPQTVVVCEGELDALVMSARVGVPTVGVPGVSSWLEHMPRCFADVRNLFVVFDNDVKEDGSNPGQVAAKKVARQIAGATVVSPPLGMDVGEWFLSEGADAIRKALGL
jgi:DNA primase